MDNKKPIPLPPRHKKPRHLCSVCGMVSYSPGGIHPQCAQEQPDDPSVEDLKSPTKSENPKETAAHPRPFSPWRKKLCPKCHTYLLARKLTCDCGHQFSSAGTKTPS